jgi:nitrate/nitrite-specific signal transduction histidine kinase
MTRPLQNLHAGALAIARGDLDTSFAVDTDDEIGDVAEAFRIMTRSLRENQEGWRARVRELVTVHQVGRAVSSVVDLGQVLRAVITEILNVLGGKTVAIALRRRGPRRRARRVRRARRRGDPVGERLAPLAGAVASLGRPRRTPAVEADPQLMDYAEAPACAGP